MQKLQEENDKLRTQLRSIIYQLSWNKRNIHDTLVSKKDYEMVKLYLEDARKLIDYLADENKKLKLIIRNIK